MKERIDKCVRRILALEKRVSQLETKPNGGTAQMISEEKAWDRQKAKLTMLKGKADEMWSRHSLMHHDQRDKLPEVWEEYKAIRSRIRETEEEMMK